MASQTLIEMKAKMAALSAELETKAERVIAEELSGWFDKNPNIIAVKWTQYTPWFNDGEPCNFNVHTYDLLFTDISGDECQAYDINEDYFTGESLSELEDIFESVPNEFFEIAFGDHVSVKASVTSESVEFDVEEYDHD